MLFFKNSSCLSGVNGHVTADKRPQIPEASLFRLLPFIFLNALVLR